MATVKEVRNTIKSHQYISDSIAYILSPENPSGNEKCFQATFLNCVNNGIASLSDQFYEIRRVFNKDYDILAQHYIQRFSPDGQITPVVQYVNSMDTFLQNEADIVFALKEHTRQIPGIQVHELFESRIYLIAGRDDPLAEKNLIREEDLYGRTLMVGGGSPLALKTVQHRLISTGKIDYFNSADHDTTLTNVAAGRGVCLAPGFLNDHSGQFAWIPFDCEEHFSCVLCTHKEDQRDSLRSFLSILTKLYADAVAFPL